ncbi:Pkinase-domain-containing protein [Dorcoceras hygrometricum]|uniref:Pkinase-domain-containing protein n=1 Tax=Dorcoceras hygrometricum TaxID=472368 RepID=A0A2Z7CFN6_9LAMI|nr:Pkinase-domain-containing protein [Dorcoceras hygrometricum]
MLCRSNFESVLVMKHDGMAKMFKCLEDTGLCGPRKMALTKDVFTEVFGLPTEGLKTFMDIPKESVVEMRSLFSSSDEPFREPNKKNGVGPVIRAFHKCISSHLGTDPACTPAATECANL